MIKTTGFLKKRNKAVTAAALNDLEVEEAEYGRRAAS